MEMKPTRPTGANSRSDGLADDHDGSSNDIGRRRKQDRNISAGERSRSESPDTKRREQEKEHGLIEQQESATLEEALGKQRLLQEKKRQEGERGKSRTGAGAGEENSGPTPTRTCRGKTETATRTGTGSGPARKLKQEYARLRKEISLGQGEISKKTKGAQRNTHR